ncbi:MAG: glycosyltransferase family 4 protein [Patescibacteria group bacterium]
MKIAIISPVFPPYRGGIGTAAYTEARELARRGHDVSVFVPRRPGGQGHELKEKFKLFCPGPFLRYGNAAFLPQLRWKLKNFDVIHLHYPFFGGAEVVYKLKVKSEKLKVGTKLVITYHHDVVGSGWLGKIFRWHTKNLMPKILGRADKIIVSSLDYAKNSNVKEILEKNPEKFVEVPFGVDTEKFAPAEAKQDLFKKFNLFATRTILFVGGLDRAHYFKGLEVLIKARAEVANAKILVVGDGDLRPHYEKMVEELNLKDQVIFAGSVTAKDLPDYYNLADVVVLPSLDQSEAFGIVLIEAAACGKSIIASNLPGVRSVVQYGVNGFTFPPGNAKELAEKINYFLDNPAAAKDFGKHGREIVLEKYDLKKVGERLESVIASAVGAWQSYSNDNDGIASSLRSSQ